MLELQSQLLHDHKIDVLNCNSEKCEGWSDRGAWTMPCASGNMPAENFLFNNFSDIPGIFLQSHLVCPLHIPETFGWL
jgi:hypothetical protein